MLKSFLSIYSKLLYVNNFSLWKYLNLKTQRIHKLFKVEKYKLTLTYEELEYTALKFTLPNKTVNLNFYAETKLNLKKSGYRTKTKTKMFYDTKIILRCIL